MSPSPPEAPQSVIVPHLPIELCQFLKFAALTASGGEGKKAVADGRVQVNGALESRKRRKLVVGDRVDFAGRVIVVAPQAPA